jgi:hypothetical protein
MTYKCNCCSEIFETPTPSYRTVSDGKGGFEREYDCECCPECGSRNYSEVSSNEL